MSGIITSIEELERLYYRGEQFNGYLIGPMGEFRIKNLPHGLFMGRIIDGCVDSIQWGRKLPLIDAEILKRVIEYFRQDLSKEACVRICYDSISRNYFFVAANGKASGVRIDYDFSSSIHIVCRPGIYVVCEIHSHNRMPAFFSCVDDADEQYHPAGLFGVIGRLQDEEPELQLRVCMDGVSKEIDVSELFHMG